MHSHSVHGVLNTKHCPQKKHSNPIQNPKSSSAGNAKETTSRRIAPLSPTKAGQNILGPR